METRPAPAKERRESRGCINRDALVFAFAGLMGALLVMQRLQAAGVVRDFKGGTGQLPMALVFLIGAGVFWSHRRFR